MAEKLKVVITNEQKEVKIQTGIRMLLRRCCHAVIENEGFDEAAEIAIEFTDRDNIQKLTDREDCEMIAGASDDAQNSEDKMRKLGKIYISVDSAMETAETHNATFQSRMVFLTANGVLELLSAATGTKASRMENKDKVELVMFQLGMPPSTRFYIDN